MSRLVIRITIGYSSIYSQKIFKNKNLRRSFEPKRDKNEESNTLQNEVLYNLYVSPNVVKAIKLKKR